MRKPGSGSLRRIVFLSLYCSAALGLAECAPLNAQENPSSQAPQELDLKAYAAELDRIAAASRQSKEIPQLRSSLPRSWSVRNGDTHIEVSTEPLLSELRQLEANPEKTGTPAHELQLRLDAMRKAATEMAALENKPSGRASERLNKILARREFRSSQGPSQFEILVSRITRWIFDRIVRVLSRIHISSRTGNALAWGVMILAFAALCYMVFRWLYAGSKKSEFKAEATPHVSDAREWVRDALAAAERGDYREAIHCAYWAAVAKLEDSYLLKSDRARTPRESLRLLEHHPKEQRLLREMTGHFELIWYGYRPASSADWSGARDHLEKMGCLRP